MADDPNPTRSNEGEEMGRNVDDERVDSSDDQADDVDELDTENEEDVKDR